MTISPLRAAAALALLVFAVAFFLPTVEMWQGEAPMPGWEAFWLSFSSWGEMSGWDRSAIPLVFAWLANVGGLVAAVALLRERPLGRLGLGVAMVLAALGLGPLLSAAEELLVGYYSWLGAIVTLVALAVAQARRRPAPPAARPLRTIGR